MKKLIGWILLLFYCFEYLIYDLLTLNINPIVDKSLRTIEKYKLTIK